jgi:hypothetical protein
MSSAIGDSIPVRDVEIEREKSLEIQAVCATVPGVKRFLFLSVVLILATGRAPGVTAYEALQVIKKSRGDAVLKQLVEVRGETGQPQPQSWTILMSDATARGGVREFVVTGSEIASERTPLRSGLKTPAPLDFARLNLDSDGAFKLAVQQATKARFGFHSVDYTLKTAESDGAPAWSLHLFDYMGAPVGNLLISAENGKIVQALQVDPDARQQTAKASADADGEPSTHFKGGVFGFVERTAKNIGTKTKDVSVGIGEKVRDTTLNVAGTVQEALIGERTIGEPSPTPTP